MTSYPALFRFDVLPADSVLAVAGGREGEGLSGAGTASEGEIYRLAKRARALRLAVSDAPETGACVADGSEVGRPGAALTATRSLVLMSTEGRLSEVLVVTIDGEEWLLPLEPLSEETEYEFVTASTDDTPTSLSDVLSLSFVTGTRLSLADGRLVPVETLEAGDRVLTRFNGAQPIRWIGQRTRRITTGTTPVRLRAGTLGLLRDLILEPHHRVFVWQRRDAIGAGRAEVLVRAADLVDGRRAVFEPLGHVDTVQLVFDRHEFVYAEGLAVDGMLMAGPLPEAMRGAVDLTTARQDQRHSASLEPAAKLGPDAARRLSRASRGEPD